MSSAFWILAGTMLVLALSFMTLPVWRNRRRDKIDRDLLNTKVVREQLSELKADRESGKLDASAYEAARHDLERELLDALDHQTEDEDKPAHSGRWLPLLLVPAVPLVAVLLYQQLGAGIVFAEPEPQQAQNSNSVPSQHNINLMLEKLVERLRKEPNHPDGWMLLGRSYTSLHRYDDAVAAYEQARKYGGDTPELLIDYADTLITANGGDFSDKVGDMLRQAMAKQPDNPKGLWLMGHWYFQRGDYRKALSNWEQVAGQVQPGSENDKVLQQQIKIARAKLGDNAPPEAVPATNTASAGTGKASIQVSVSLDPALTSSASPDDTVFIFARAVSGPRMPLAIVRKQVRDLPVTVTLDDSLAMSPAMVLSRFPQVAIGARVSKTGQAMPAPGDLQGMQSPVPTHNTKNTVKIVINTQVGS